MHQKNDKNKMENWLTEVRCLLQPTFAAQINNRKWRLVKKKQFFGNTNWDLISGILIQFAAATAARGTKRPTIGGAF